MGQAKLAIDAVLTLLRAVGVLFFYMGVVRARRSLVDGHTGLSAREDIGTGLVMVGVILWVAKKKNPQISWGWVLTAFGAGFILIAIDQFIKKGQSTIQLNPVDVG